MHVLAATHANGHRRRPGWDSDTYRAACLARPPQRQAPLHYPRSSASACLARPPQRQALLHHTRASASASLSPTYLPTYLRAIRKVWYNFIYTHRHGGAKHGIKWHSAVAIHRPWDCVLTRAMWRVPMQVDAYTRDHRGGQGAAWKEVLDDLQNAILHYHDTNADGTLATQEMADNIKRWLEVNSTGW